MGAGDLPHAGEAGEGGDVAQVDRALAVALAAEAEHGVGPDRDAAVDGAGEVDAEEGQVGVGHGIDERVDEAVAGRGQAVVLTPERHDLERVGPAS